MTIIFLQDIISFHWMVSMCVGGVVTRSPSKKSPCPLLLLPLPLFLVPVQTSELPEKALSLLLGKLQCACLKGREKRRKLRSSDTKSLDFERSVICQDQQNHKMPTYLREAPRHK